MKTNDIGDLSCEDSAASLLVPAEETQREYTSPNKETNVGNDNCVVTSSAGNAPHPDTTLCPVGGNDRSVATEGRQDSANPRVTKVTGIKQKLVIVDSKQKSRSNKRIKKKANSDDATKLYKKKISFAKIDVSSDASFIKPVAVKSSSEVVTSTPNGVSKDFNQELQILRSDKLKSPNTSLDAVLMPSRTVKKLSMTITRTNQPPAKADRSSKTDQKFNKPLSNTGRQSSKIDQHSLKIGLQSSKVDQQSSKSDQQSSKSDQSSSKTNQHLSKTDQKANKVANQALSKVDEPLPQDVAMTTKKNMIGVVINKTSHDADSSITSRQTRSADSLVKLVLI